MLDPKKVMPKATAEVFSIINNLPELQNFYLIGGTALSLHLGHRLSEDLDFITKANKLPRSNINATMTHLKQKGLNIARNDPEAAYDDFQIAGMELHDYSQNFIVGNECKVTFFTAEEHHRRLLLSELRTDGPTIASLDELQDLKAVVCASRSNSRDWLDLYILAKQHNFTLEKWKDAFKKSGLVQGQFDTALKRIQSGKLPPTDPGFHSLVPNPPTIEEISNYFSAWIKTAQTQQTKKIKVAKSGKDAEQITR